MSGRHYNSAKPFHHEEMEEGNLNFRLCHVCLTLNESLGEIVACVTCNHVFQDEILQQFFDTSDTEAFSDTVVEEEDAVEEDELELERASRRPNGNVQGLSVRF